MKNIRIIKVIVLIAFTVLWIPKLLSGEPHTLLLRKTFPMNSDQILKVNSYTGNVKIDSWERNVIEVRIYGSPEAQRDLGFNVNSDGTGINIAALKKTAVDNIGKLGLRYEINVPSDYSVRVDGSKKVTIDRHSLPVDLTE